MTQARSFFPLPLLAALAASLLAACAGTPSQPGSPAAQPPARSVAPGTLPAPAEVPRTSKGGGFYKDDGPGDSIPPDLDSIPDALPRVEPLRQANTRPYEALGQSFTPMRELAPFSQTGIGSWYGKKFHGAKTASGERYNMFAMTAAHPTLPLPSYARVSNLENGRSVVVRVNDRGPFLHSRIIDLSYAAAHKLAYTAKGSARLQVDLILPAEYANYANPAQAPGATNAAVQSQQPLAEASAPLAAPAVASAAQPAAASDFRVSPAAEAPPPQGIFLQLGAFSSPGNATGFRDYVLSELKWLKQGVQAYLIGDKYRLRVGPFSSSKEAREIGGRIAAAIKIQPFLIE